MSDFVIRVILEGNQAEVEANSLGQTFLNLEGTVNASFESMVGKVAAFSFAFNQVKTFAQDVATVIEEPIERFNRLETAMANVESLGVPNINSLRGSVLDLAEDTAVPLDTLASGLYDVVSAGVDAENQITFLELSAQAAKAGLAETTDSIALSSAVVKGFGKDWADTETILDQAFKTVELGQTTFQEIAGSIGQVTPQAAALKFETFELFGAFATLTGVTGGTAEVSTQLKAIFTELARPTAELTELVRQNGFASVEQLAAQEGLAGVLKIVQDATGGSAAKMTQLFSSTEAVTALLSLTTSQYETFIEKSEEIATSQGAMTNAFEIQNETIESQLQLIENKLTVAMIETIDTIRPVIGTILEYTVSLLEVDYEPFIIGTVTAAAALGGLQIGITITALGGLSGALQVAGVAFTTFSRVATAAITSIPVAGWIAAAVSGLAALSVALIATADDEEDLAIQRRTVAEETINITEAEIDRVKQAIETQGATQQLTEQLENMNQHLINQRKIIADANIEIYTKQLRDARTAVFDLAQEWGDLSFGVSDGIDRTVDTLRELIGNFGENFVAMEEEVGSRLVEVIDLIRKSEAGAIELSEERIRQLKEERESLTEVNKVVTEAADKQRLLNQELERLKALGDIEYTITENKIKYETTIRREIEEETPDKPDSSSDAQERERNIRISNNIEEQPVDLPFFDDDAFLDGLDNELELNKLRFDAQIIQEQEFLDNRYELLREGTDLVREQLGEESRLFLQMKAATIAAEEERNEARKAMYISASSQIITNMSGLMTAAQGTNKTLFDLGKAAAIAQATIDTIAGATRAFKDFPLPLAIPVAATVTALGIANVAKIAATEFQSRAEGGPISSENRTVSKGDFGNGENRLIIANDGEFIINAGQTAKNLSILEYINNSDQAFDLIGDKIVSVSSIPNQIDGGLINRINSSNAAISAIVSRSESGSSSGQVNLQEQFDRFREDVVEAIQAIRIEIKGAMDGQEFLKENLERAEKAIRDRRAI